MEDYRLLSAYTAMWWRIQGPNLTSENKCDNRHSGAKSAYRNVAKDTEGTTSVKEKSDRGYWNIDKTVTEDTWLLRLVFVLNAWLDKLYM